jgi:hypothetical protein
VRTATEFEELVGTPLVDFAYQCHAASLALVHALGEGRVARGTRPGVLAQHSWVVLGNDCYSPAAKVLDPTLWSYQNQHPYVWNGLSVEGLYCPHGSGSIWAYGRPPRPTGPVIELAVDPGEEATAFLEFCAPKGLDREGWSVLLHAPVEDWPAAAVVEAAYQTPAIAALLPVDIVGMLTDLNPGELYR